MTSPFAAFYGFNTRPVVATGGTYLRNIINRPFFNVSTDNDYYYPPGAHDTLDSLMKAMGADYQDHRYLGFPHWFPQFDESERAHQLLFADLAKRSRNPFHHEIEYECDDSTYGRCDWLLISRLDTLKPRADWHSDINFQITKWKIQTPKNQLAERDTLLNAFRFPKKSAKVKAKYHDNIFELETSDVGSLSVLISPEMVDLAKPVIIKVNGIKMFDGVAKYNKDILWKEFLLGADRKALWVTRIDVGSIN